jgi:hypothetical protein
MLKRWLCALRAVIAAIQTAGSLNMHGVAADCPITKETKTSLAYWIGSPKVAEVQQYGSCFSASIYDLSRSTGRLLNFKFCEELPTPCLFHMLQPVY